MPAAFIKEKEGSMPPLARTFVKASFVYLVAALALGALMALDGLGIGGWLSRVYLSQVHLLMVGWISQLAIGVAYWMFPRLLREQSPMPRGADWLTWTVILCLNAGLVLRFAFEPFALMSGKGWLQALVALSGVLQALAAVGFAVLIWGRIRAMEP
jgi:cbb3-type cytochrome oxidase subunit 1